MSDQAALPNLNADWVNAKGQFLNIKYSNAVILLGWHTRCLVMEQLVCVALLTMVLHRCLDNTLGTDCLPQGPF